MAHETREGWLREATLLLDTRVLAAGQHPRMPKKWAVSCGFPKGHANAIGQCFDPQWTPDGTVHMFICPTIHEATRVLDILLHEMIHAAVGCKCGHRGPFKKVARAVGLEGKLTATVVTYGTPLHLELTSIAGVLGPYPHGGMVKMRSLKKAASGWVRLRSKTDDNYTVVISPKNLELYGAPTDPFGDEMEQV